MKLTSSTKQHEIKRSWHLFDIEGKILGRVATEIVHKLMGKSKPYFVSYLDCGDYLVVINAAKVRVSGNKRKNKLYKSFSGYPGGLKIKNFEKVIQENPTLIIRQAVSGMLPKNKLRASWLKRLFIYADDKHPYSDKIQSTKLEARNPKS